MDLRCITKSHTLWSQRRLRQDGMLLAGLGQTKAECRQAACLNQILSCFSCCHIGFDHSAKEASSRSFVAHKGAEGETIRTWASWLLGVLGRNFGFQRIQDSDCLMQSLRIEIQIWKCEGFRGLVWFGTTPAMRNFDSFSIRSTKTRQIMTFCASCEWPWHLH